MAMSRSRGLEVVHHPAVDLDGAGGDRFEPGDHAQKRGLAAAGRPDDDDELAVGDVDRHALDHLDAAG